MTTLYVTNDTDILPIECNSKIRTRVSEECMTQFTYKDKIDPEQVVLKVLLDELKIKPDEQHQWYRIEPE